METSIWDNIVRNNMYEVIRMLKLSSGTKERELKLKHFFLMFSLEQDPDQEPEARHNQKSKCINMYQRLCAISEKKIK